MNAISWNSLTDSEILCLQLPHICTDQTDILAVYLMRCEYRFLEQNLLHFIQTYVCIYNHTIYCILISTGVQNIRNFITRRSGCNFMVHACPGILFRDNNVTPFVSLTDILMNFSPFFKQENTCNWKQVMLVLQVMPANPGKQCKIKLFFKTEAAG